MVMFSVRQFKGIAPRAEPRLLQDNQAQTAVNCKLWHGSLRPLSANGEAGVTLPLAAGGEVKTIYRYKAVAGGIIFSTHLWFHWLEDVDVCRGAIFDDTLGRVYLSGTDPFPLKAELEPLVIGSLFDFNAQTITLDDPLCFTLGVPAPSTKLTAVASGSGQGIAETRVYTYTYVTAWGEEGKPAPPSDPVDVLPGQGVNLTGFIQLPFVVDGDIVGIRLYRTASSGASAEFFFVAEAVGTREMGMGLIEPYPDTIATENLGEVLPSAHYSMPPSSLKGLAAMPNGMLAGFDGKDVYFCEPYKPHAWPLSYVLTVEHDIVAFGVIDTTLIVLTDVCPFIIQGASPDSMTMVKGSIPQACVSKRSVAFLAGSVVFASPDGLFAIGNGTVNLTETIFTNKEWRELFNPSSINGYVCDDKYIGFYDLGTGVKGGFILDPRTGDFTMLGFHATAGYYDPQIDGLFLVVDGVLVRFDAGTASLKATWETKDFYSPFPINMGAIRVEAAAYPVTAQVFADGEYVYTAHISSKRAQRLPAGFLANVWKVRIMTSFEVYSLTIGQTMAEVAHG